MNLGYFLGGAILGAAGLTAAALIDDKLNPKPTLPDSCLRLFRICAANYWVDDICICQ